MIMGAHVDQVDPVAQAQALDAQLSQFFLGDPQSYKKPEVRYAGGAAALRAAAATAGIALYVHAPYRINVASTNNRIRIPSRKLLDQTMQAAATIGAAGVVVHAGHVTADDDPEAGFDNWRKAVERMELPVPMLIENTAGGENAMARRLDRIARLWEVVAGADDTGKVGFCLDTCHAHAGGLELPGLVAKITAITGRIDLIHANDSRDAFDSGADRHANLGSGRCDPEGLAETALTAGAPIVLETPGGMEGHLADLDWLRTRYR